MKTNDIKKGMRIRLYNGWYGTMMDSKKGNIRVAEVEGYYTEVGSIYSHDISHVQVPSEDIWVPVELTDKQKKFKKEVEAFKF